MLLGVECGQTKFAPFSSVNAQVPGFHASPGGRRHDTTQATGQDRIGRSFLLHQPALCIAHRSANRLAFQLGSNTDVITQSTR